MLDVKDRIPAIGKAGRKKITYENGHEEYATIEMADEPIEAGTPINRALFESIRADLENVMASLVPPWSNLYVERISKQYTYGMDIV